MDYSRASRRHLHEDRQQAMIRIKREQDLIAQLDALIALTVTDGTSETTHEVVEEESEKN